MNNVSNPTTPTPTPAPPIPSDNLLPVAHPDSVIIPAEGFVSVDVLENDKAADEHEVFVNATASNNDDCSVGLDHTTVMVHPQGNADGSCEYEVCDEQNMCSKATITFTVEDVDNNNNKESAPTNWSEDEYEVEYEVEAFETCIPSGQECGQLGRRSNGLWDTSTEDTGCYITRQEVADNECPRITGFIDPNAPEYKRYKSNLCCSGGCIIEEYELESTALIDRPRKIQGGKKQYCDFLPEGALCGQDNQPDRVLILECGIKYPGCNPETDGTWTGERFKTTYSKSKQECVSKAWWGYCYKYETRTETYTHTWNADDIGRARAPPHCEVYALKDPIYWFSPRCMEVV